MKKGKPLSWFVIFLLLLLLYIPLGVPIEGGNIFIVLGSIWLFFQLWQHSEFSISHAFLVLIAWLAYLLIYRLYAKPIPISDKIVQRMIIFLMLAFFMYSSLRSVDDRKPWENALIALAIVISLFSILEAVNWYSRYFTSVESLQVLPKPQLAYRLRGFFFGHPNPLAGFLNFVWPIIFIRLYNSKQPYLKFLWGILILVLSVIMLYTNSRGGLLGTFSGIAFFVFAILLSKGINLRKILSFSVKDKRQTRIIVAGMLMLIVLLFGVLWRAKYTGQSRTISFSGRGTIWKYSWQAFQEHPVIGQGIGVFPISYTRLAELPPGDFAPSAHNLLLQVSVDYGIVGLVFICILIGIFMFHSLKILRATNTKELPFEFAYIVGCIAFLAQHTVDFMLVTTNYLVVSFVLFVLIFRYVLHVEVWHVNKKTYALAGIFIIGLLAIDQTIISHQVMNFSDYAHFVQLANNDDWVSLQEQLCSKARDYPVNALYKFECSIVTVKRMSEQVQTNKISDDDKSLSQAIDFQQSGYDINPYWSIQEANLAVLYWEEGDRAKAIDHMQRAVSSAPMSDLLLINLGWMEENIGNQDLAISYYTRALRINPMINASAFVGYSNLIDIATKDLVEWGDSEELWGDWYDATRHDRVKYDHDYWGGIIALSTGRYALAINRFQVSLQSGTPPPDLYAYLAYAYMLDGQPELANKVAKDTALLTLNNVHGLVNPTTLSIIASILRNNDETDLAYDLLLVAFQNARNEVIYKRYYPMIYTQQFLTSDISPLLIKNQWMPLSTQNDWDWFTDEAMRRGNALLARDVANWREQLQGIAYPIYTLRSLDIAELIQ